MVLIGYLFDMYCVCTWYLPSICLMHTEYLPAIYLEHTSYVPGIYWVFTEWCLFGTYYETGRAYCYLFYHSGLLCLFFLLCLIFKYTIFSLF